MRLNTDAIEDSGFFNPRYTYDVDNSSPELRWEDIPENTIGFALTVEDQSAPQGLFYHWVVYNIPSSVHHLPAGIPPQDTLPNGIRQGINGFRKLGYAGPFPPDSDLPHRYVFRLYALNEMPVLPNRSTAEQLLEAIRDRIVGVSEFSGMYAQDSHAGRQIQRAG